MDCRCPRKLKSLPSSACPEGRKALDAARRGETAGCPWFVADPESSYCFFRFMADDGRTVPPHRIARLNMIDDSDVKRIIQSFRRRVPELLAEKE